MHARTSRGRFINTDLSLPSTVYSYHTLPSGLRIVHVADPHAAAEYFGVTVDAGSRDEPPAQYGLAHFVEHTIFKGTPSLSSIDIINEMESVGGELNAYTTKEETVVYSIFPLGHLTRAASLIAQLVTEASFPEEEINREREVVADEINSYLDIPAEAIADDFDDLIFAGSQLGHNILGSLTTLNTFTSASCREWLARMFLPSRMAVFYLGATPADEVFRTIDRCFNTLPASVITPPERHAPVYREPFDMVNNIESHQSHTILGARSAALYSPLRQATALLTNIIGGPGMNSMLNIELREKRGLVYSADASSSAFTDCGATTLYFGCDPTDTSRCIRIANEILDRLATQPLDSRELDKAKQQFAGQMIIGSESREAMALSAGRALLRFGKVPTLRERTDRLMAVTPEELNNVASDLAPNLVSRLSFC